MAAPIIISTWSFSQRANERAMEWLREGRSSLDAVERAAKTVEEDPNVDSVGFGGLPDASGRLSLDAAVMLSPARCGSVCMVRRFMHPVSIARAVMERTGHRMLAGEGADEFGSALGMLPADLLSADAHDAYQKWRKDHKPIDQSRDSAWQAPRPMDRPNRYGRLFFHPAPPPGDDSGDRPPSTPPPSRPKPPDESTWKHHDTIGTLALDAHGVLAGACSTSGTPFKMPGRVGDSPIIGHGLYVDPKVGAVTATGAGELVMGVCGSFLGVELMRVGRSPLDALTAVLQRIIDSYDLKPEHQVAFIALTPDGRTASAALRPGFKTAIATSDHSDVRDPDAVMLNES